MQAQPFLPVVALPASSTAWPSLRSRAGTATARENLVDMCLSIPRLTTHSFCRSSRARKMARHLAARLEGHYASAPTRANRSRTLWRLRHWICRRPDRGAQLSLVLPRRSRLLLPVEYQCAVEKATTCGSAPSGWVLQLARRCLCSEACLARTRCVRRPVLSRRVGRRGRRETSLERYSEMLSPRTECASCWRRATFRVSSTRWSFSSSRWGRLSSSKGRRVLTSSSSTRGLSR
mmetsp:Transcript_47106/g.74380  ORF Transcript_47106/g.74380 Transcript_47106/m.74380 type:complete len:234 (+) Transcript_47106:61-762(+)